VAGLGSVGAYQEAAFVVQVADRAFDHPAFAAEAGAVVGLAASDDWTDAAGTKRSAVLVVVIAAVGEQPIGPTSGPPRPASDGRDSVYQWQELGDVVAIGGGHRPCQEQAASVGQDVVLDARPAAVDRAWPDPEAPFFACT
jgi:hypothetical protein